MKKIQIYLSETKDDTLYGLVTKLEIESEGKRGYVPEKIKERLLAFELISEYFGIDEPMKVLMKVMQALPSEAPMEKEKTVMPKTIQNKKSKIGGKKDLFQA